MTRKCRDCGKEIGVHADKCIHCGAWQETSTSWLIAIIGVGIMIIFWAFVFPKL